MLLPSYTQFLLCIKYLNCNCISEADFIKTLYTNINKNTVNKKVCGTRASEGYALRRETEG